MANWKDWQLNKEHQHNLLRQAEYARLANSLPPQSEQTLTPVLAQLWRKLASSWGNVPKPVEAPMAPASKRLKPQSG